MRRRSVPFHVDPEHEDLAERLEQRRFFWLDMGGTTEEQLRELAAKFGLHQLDGHCDDIRHQHVPRPRSRVFEALAGLEEHA